MSQTSELGCSAIAANLLALCKNRAQTQVFSLLQDEAILQIVFKKEPFPIYRGAERTTKHLILERMIHTATKHNHIDLLKALLNFGREHGVAAPNIVTSDILYATLNPATTTIDLLLALEQAMPEVLTLRLGHAATIFDGVVACSHKDQPCPRVPVVRHLLDMGVPMSFAKYGFRSGGLLMVASGRGCRDVVELLLQHGAVIKNSGAHYEAVRSANIEVLDLLLQHRVDLDECSSAGPRPTGSALHTAVSRHRPESVKWLLENGASPALKNNRSQTPREVAESQNLKQIIALFDSYLVD